VDFDEEAWGAFREHSGSSQATFSREHAGHIQRTFREYSMKVVDE
jgi:hypothetical protein